jgi:hypothetical protein
VKAYGAKLEREAVMDKIQEQPATDASMLAAAAAAAAVSATDEENNGEDLTSENEKSDDWEEEEEAPPCQASLISVLGRLSLIATATFASPITIPLRTMSQSVSR